MQQTEQLEARIDPNQTPEERRARIRAAYEENKSQMTVMLARKLGVPELEVMRSLEDNAVTELDVSRWEELLRRFTNFGDVHVISTNGSLTLECHGQFGNFSTWGEYFNVQTKSLDMHLRYKTLSAIFAVEKPGHMDGVPTISFQFFNHDGDSAFKVFLTFGNKPPSPEIREQFTHVCEEFRSSAAK